MAYSKPRLVFDSDAEDCLARQEARLRSKGLRLLLWSLVLAVALLASHSVLTCFSAARTQDLFDRAPMIDGHNDFPIWIRAFYQNHIYQNNFTEPHELYGQVDFPRLAKGRLRGQFWSVYVECPKQVGNETSDDTYREIVHDTLQQIDIVYRLIRSYPGQLQHAWSAADVRAQFTSSRKISSLIGIEGLHQIGSSVSILRMYHQLGVRYATLTHTCHNQYADSEEPAMPLNYGLSMAGKDLVWEMNRMGMIVDISHTSFATQRDVLNISLAPVIFSHSNTYAVHQHTRNVPDDILLSLKRNDGVIMCTFYPAFTANPSSEASIVDVANHIEYAGNLIGYRHVGIGSDFDGMQHSVKGLEDVSKYPKLIEELKRRGIPDVNILEVMGLSVLRVLEGVERVSAALEDVRPLEDNIRPFFASLEALP